MRGSGLARYDFTVFVWLSASGAALADESLDEHLVEDGLRGPDKLFLEVESALRSLTGGDGRRRPVYHVRNVPELGSSLGF